MAFTRYADGDIVKDTVTGMDAGDGLSSAVNLAGKILLAIEMPTAWTTAGLTFELATDGTNYFDVYVDGVEYNESAAGASRVLLINPNIGYRLQGSVKLRSGTSGTPVTQGAERTLILIAAKL